MTAGAATATSDLTALPIRVAVDSGEYGNYVGDTSLSIYDYPMLDEIEEWVNGGPQKLGGVANVSQAQENLKQVGAPLFDVTLGAWGQWPNLLADARQSGTRIRVEILTPNGQIASQPWELMFDMDSGAFIGLERGVSITRNPSRIGKVRQLPTAAPLRVLMVGATPSDLGEIAVAAELNMLAGVLNGLGGAVEAYTLTSDPRVCTWASFVNALRNQGPWHVIHFSGHGGFEPALADGMLAFTDNQGRLERVSASMLSNELSAHSDLRLVVLNACRGAMGVGRQVVNSVAGSIVQRGVPACISMQFEITDPAAIPFAGTFHLALVKHGDVELALMDAREAVSHVSLDPALAGGLRSAEWATPVLHLDARDPVILPVDNTSIQAPGVTPVRPPIERVEFGDRVRVAGSLTDLGSNKWQLQYATSLDVERAVTRAEKGVRAVSDVRKIAPRGNGFEALIGGLFPGAWAAVQVVNADVQSTNQGTIVTVTSQPKGTQFIDGGMNRQLLERLASHLGVRY